MLRVRRTPAGSMFGAVLPFWISIACAVAVQGAIVALPRALEGAPLRRLRPAAGRACRRCR